MYAVVTGASSGIGRELAKEFAKRGFHVIIVARRESKLLELQEEIIRKFNVRVLVFTCDLSKTKECYRLEEFCKDKDIRILINNAGIGKASYVTAITNKDDLTMLQTNIIAVHLLTKLFAKIMKQGIICNVASTAAFQPGPGMAAYGASKAYVYQFSRAMNYELKKQKSRLRIATLCPGPVDTDFAGNNSDGGLRKKFMLSPEKCAKISVKEILKGKELIIPGINNRILKNVTKVLPENLVLPMEYKIQRAKFKL